MGRISLTICDKCEANGKKKAAVYVTKAIADANPSQETYSEKLYLCASCAKEHTGLTFVEAKKGEEVVKPGRKKAE